MTVRELSKLYYIKKLIERDLNQLAEFESRLDPGSMNLSGMPHNPNPKNAMEEVVPLIIELKQKIERERDDYIRERLEIENYIKSVDDYQVRLIISYRFVDLMTWRQVAMMIGGNNTEDGIKKICYRFLKKSEKK